MYNRTLLMIALLFSPICLAAENIEPFDSTIKSMKDTIKSLGIEKNFGFFDLGLSEREKLLLDSIRIKNSSHYSCYGDLAALSTELPTFLREIGIDDEETLVTITDIISRAALNVAKALNKETAWVKVQSFLTTNFFNTPRWHRDGSYYKPYGVECFKFASTLKGNHTLFYQLPTNMREEFKKAELEQNRELIDILIGKNKPISGQLSIEALSEKNRELLDKLIDKNNVVSGQLGMGAFFIVGDPDSSAIHSEPIIDGDRLFFSIVAGNQDEIEEWQKK